METQAENVHPFETIYQQHRPRIYGVLVRLLKDQDEAEDVTQQVFLKLYRAQPHQLPADDHKLVGWLYRVALNEGYNHLRSQKRRSSWHEKLNRLWVGKRSAPDSAQVIEQQDVQQQVREILAEMKPREANLLLLRHAGLSYKELAVALNVPNSSIGSMLTQARRKFAKKYESIVAAEER
jgi:RNA polymerase sigma-70 factor (ECF subfamily)